MKYSKVVNIQPKHFNTMINFNWECTECGYENTASLIEEEDLTGHLFVTLTCKCGRNNRIKVSDMYKHHD